METNVTWCDAAPLCLRCAGRRRLASDGPARPPACSHPLPQFCPSFALLLHFSEARAHRMPATAACPAGIIHEHLFARHRRSRPCWPHHGRALHDRGGRSGRPPAMPGAFIITFPSTEHCLLAEAHPLHPGRRHLQPPGAWLCMPTPCHCCRGELHHVTSSDGCPHSVKMGTSTRNGHTDK